jgi:hypothetical protein
MIPTGFSPDGNLTFRMTGFFSEVFDNLQVSETALKKVMADLRISKTNVCLTGFILITGNHEFYIHFNQTS